MQTKCAARCYTRRSRQSSRSPNCTASSPCTSMTPGTRSAWKKPARMREENSGLPDLCRWDIMQTIQATQQNGVFTPQEDIHLAEGTRVKLKVELADTEEREELRPPP